MAKHFDKARVNATSPTSQFALRDLDGKRLWVSEKIAGIKKTDDPRQAILMSAAFLSETCWSWEIYYRAESLEDLKKLQAEAESAEKTTQKAVKKPVESGKTAIKSPKTHQNSPQTKPVRNSGTPARASKALKPAKSAKKGKR